ncbi:MAG: hypothetical protein JRD04_06135 [Deltaproteobacteria bacterium]|nr:hypothetical protein [Deltaproteobacteria bacterium]
MKNSSGSFEVDLFPSEVDSPDHPYASQFKDMLESVADQYGCRLISFEVRKGSAMFSFDNAELNSEILELLKQ